MQCRQCGSPLGDGAAFCPQCGTTLVVAGVAEQAASATPVSRKKWFIAAVMVLVLVAGLSAYLRVLLREFHPVIDKQPDVVVELSYGVEQKIPSVKISARMDRGSIVIPLTAVRESKLVRFDDPEGIQSVPILAYITPEGKIVTAMSISENCRSTDFYLQGHNIHCASCPSYWNMSSLEAYACCQQFFPDPIPSSLLNEEIRIDAEIVRKWRTRI